MMKYYYILFFTLMNSIMMNAQQIKSVQAMPTEIGKFEKIELVASIDATFSNPYDYDFIVLRATMIAPSGQKDTVEGFFMQNFDLNTSSGNLTTKGAGDWLIRYTPSEVGVWQYEVTLTVDGKSSNSVNGSFKCNNSTVKGFVRKNSSHYLSFDNGEQYIPVGQNLCWNNGNPYFSYKSWLEKMGAAKANFMRFWLCHWGLGIEWKKDANSGYDGLRKYKQNNAWYLDWVIEKCRNEGIYMMFCINHHGQVSSQVNPNWSDSPYNVANGGMCAQTWNFFDNNEAKLTHKNRLRYIVARWGYSPNIMTWELFNEVNWTDAYSSNNVKNAVRTWHDEMARYLKQIDPYKRLVSTSYGKDEDPLLWNLASMDYTQTHNYLSVPNIERSIADDSQSFIEDYSKPTICGEFGIDVGSGSGTSSVDPKGIHLHNTLWGTTFSGAMGAGATWWWDSYTDPRNLYAKFTPVAKITQKITFVKDNYKPTEATLNGGGNTGNLSVSPSADWGQNTTATFTVNTSGISSGKLGQYLYGSQWNTQLRNPPTFNVDYPTAGKFTIRTGGQTGQMPRISIYLDGNLVLDQAAAVNQVFSIDVPSGQHSIKVDNLGTDWIRIQEYVFAGLGGSPINAYVLKSSNKEKIAAWVHHRAYNWRDAQNMTPAELKNVSCSINDMTNGNYTISFYDCTNAELLSSSNVNVINNQLSVELPSFNWDVVLLATKAGEVANQDLVETPQIKLYPNPLRAGGVLFIEASRLQEGNWDINIFNTMGQIIKKQALYIEKGSILNLGLPNDLTPGIYLCNISNGKQATIQPFIIH
jgi:hypothetical protein